ncbi:MAG: hypothetical protein HY330_05815 [Chloroflexi bacterium]|nr:hypothetical protein [Chloroflexota bacterium]
MTTLPRNWSQYTMSFTMREELLFVAEFSQEGEERPALGVFAHSRGQFQLVSPPLTLGSDRSERWLLSLTLRESETGRLFIAVGRHDRYVPWVPGVAPGYEQRSLLVYVLEPTEEPEKRL